MSNQPTIFNFDTASVRVVTINGQPWFVAKDVCDALGMSNPTVAVSTLDNDERAKFNLGQRGLNDVNIVNESGLYAIIVQSRKPEAKRFRKWVTSEVLPTIRKTGIYSVAPQPAVPALDLRDPDALIGLLTVYAQDKKKLQIENAQQAAVIEQKNERLAEVEPKAQVFDQTFNEKNRPTIADVVRKMDGVNSMTTKRDLSLLGYLYPIGSCYRVRSEYRGVFFEEKMVGGFDNIVCLEKGIELLGSLYASGKLTMKKGFLPPVRIAQPALIQ